MCVLDMSTSYNERATHLFRRIRELTDDGFVVSLYWSSFLKNQSEGRALRRAAHRQLTYFLCHIQLSYLCIYNIIFSHNLLSLSLSLSLCSLSTYQLFRCIQIS